MCNLAILCLFIAIVFVCVGIPVSLGQQSVCVNNTLSKKALWNCVERRKCIYTNRIPAKSIVSCGAKSICCPSPLTKPNITHPTPEEMKEANLIALNECHKYQGYRYHNYTDHRGLGNQPMKENSKLDCETDIVKLVRNGNSVKEKEYPFMALLGYSDDVSDETKWKCGGTLISSQYILTAAHCTKIKINTFVKWALLGKILRTNITQDLRYKNLFKVVERINHPLFKAGNSDKENNDIALLKLENEVPLSSSIRPICLYHDKIEAKVHSKVIVSGWGATVAGEVGSDDLRKAVIFVLEESICIDQFRTDVSLQNGFDKTTMICGGDLENGRDSCPDDSGGPMLMTIKNYTCMYLQVGVVSYGPLSCGENKPAIYTRVSHYLPWIRSVAWSSNRS